MGVTIGNITNSTASSFAHNNDKDFLVLLVGSIDNELATPSIDSATYNGVAMTRVAHANADRRASCLFYLSNPASGSNTVAITFSSGTDGSGCTALSLTGVNENDIQEAVDSNTGSGTSLSRAITGARGGIILPIIAILVSGTGDLNIVPSPGTELGDLYVEVSSFALNFGSAYFRVVTAGSNTMEFTWGGSSQSWAYSALSINGLELPHQAGWML